MSLLDQRVEASPDPCPGPERDPRSAAVADSPLAVQDPTPPTLADLAPEIADELGAMSVRWVTTLYERIFDATGVQPRIVPSEVLSAQLAVLEVIASGILPMQETIFEAGEAYGLKRPPDPATDATSDPCPPHATSAPGAVVSPEAAAAAWFAAWQTANLLGGEDDFERFRQFGWLIKFCTALSGQAAAARRTPLRAMRDRGLTPTLIAREVELDPKRISVLIKELDVGDAGPDNAPAGK